MTRSSLRPAHRASLAAGFAACLTALPANAQTADDQSQGVAERRSAATLQSAEALFESAQDHRLGRGVEIDFERALALYQEAADLGHEEAKTDYALLLYRQGRPGAAMPLIVEAAEKGDSRAQYVLGLEHFNAENAPRDWPRAYALVTLANVSGLPQASEALAQMERYIPAGQREQAQELVRRWRGSRAQPALAGDDPADGTTIASRSAPAAQPADPAAEGQTGQWRVQLGTFGVPGNAERLWSKLKVDPVLTGASRELVKSSKYTVLRASGFTSRSHARKACTALEQKGYDCLVVKG